MDTGTLIAAGGAIIALLSLMFTVRHRGEDVSAKKLDEQLKPLKAEQDLFRKYHGEHFQSAKDHTAELAGLSQQIKDHEKQDDERFGRIEEMHKEIRADIKELLQR